ncbi:heavy metal translocating P-type ATPase [Eubacteriaceae bacterium ES2]|nr:heavy metal translocating P-type ATPase [Eubacteriaceae bacterium ES2]
MKLYLEGLTCASCAGKIERLVAKMPNVNDASFSMATGTLNIEEDIDFSEETTFEAVVKLVKSLEPHVVVRKTKGHKTDGAISHCQDGSCNMVHGEETGQDGRHHHHVHQHEGMEKREKIELLVAMILFIGGFLAKALLPPSLSAVSMGIFLGAYLLAGYHVIIMALKNIGHGQIFDENFLMAIATVGALILGEWPEAAGVMIFFGVGEFFQAKAVDNARNAISETIHFSAENAHLIDGESTRTIEALKVKAGDLILVKPGEKIPADGEVAEGFSYLDTSPLTGESYPRKVAVGDLVLSGMINGNEVLKIKVTKDYKDSTAVKIMHLIEEASDRKGKTEKFITKFSRYYTPTVVISALVLAIVPPLLIEGASFETWIYQSLIFLVVSCPCALVLSIPISYFGGIGRASKEGILIKGGNYLDVLYQADTFVFDKTGTLTYGEFTVLEMALADGISQESFFQAATAGEFFSNHPIAEAVRNYTKTQILESALSDYKEIPGKGTRVNLNNQPVQVGNQAFFNEADIKTPVWDGEGTVVYVAINNQYAGMLILGDQIKENAKSMITGLKNLGIKKTAMLSGDNQKTADRVGQMLGLDQVIGDCLPQDKVSEFEQIKAKSVKTVYVGDGMNDAPVLAISDAGIAMGGLGSDAAIEAADIILMKDDPIDVLKSVDIAKYTRKIMIQNIVLALGIKFLVLGLTVLGYGEMYMAIFADVGAAVITILNTTRILKYKGRADRSTSGNPSLRPKEVN